MTPLATTAKPPRRQRGYALLMVMVAVALMLVAVTAVTPNVLTEGKREKEEEMIWRGKQYVRGIKLYYRKLGRFPTTIDDLTKPKVGSLRFMRKAYKDPMNKEDGSWRLIYVGPAGQLIGSLKPGQSINFAGTGGVPGGTQPGTPASTLASARGALNLLGVTPSSQGQNEGQQGTQLGGQPGQQGTGATGTPADASQNPSPDQSQAGALPDTGSVIGGNIIGVGGKINAPSIAIYDKAKNYRLFEFIWDPSKDVVTVGQPGQQIGTPAGAPGVTGAPGQNTPQGQSPFGQPMQNFVNPTQQNPPTQNPPPQQP